jgi:hypothetical protein
MVDSDTYVPSLTPSRFVDVVMAELDEIAVIVVVILFYHDDDDGADANALPFEEEVIKNWFRNCC